MLKLQKNSSYINWNNIFFKSLVLKENKLQNSLFIALEDKINLYTKIWDFLNIDYQIINSLDNLIDYIFNDNSFFIISSNLIEQKIDQKSQLLYNSIELKKWQNISQEELIKKLISLNYSYSEFEKSASYNKKWDTINIFSKDLKKEYKITFWWDIIDEIILIKKIWEIRKDTFNLDKIFIGKIDNLQEIEKSKTTILDIIIDKNWLVILDNLEFDNFYEELIKKLDNKISFDYIWNKNLKIIDLNLKVPKIENSINLKDFLEKNNKKEIIFYTKNKETIKNFLDFNNLNWQIKETKINTLKSFIYKEKIIITDDILNNIFTKKRRKKKIKEELDLLLKIKPWDYVVHIEHWIGIFKEIIKKELQTQNWKTIKKEFIEIEYLNNDKLFVPIEEVWRVNKYVWVEKPKLTSLSWNSWEKKIQKAKKEAEEIAEELIELYAKRKIQKAYSFIEFKEQEQKFKNSFQYIHTPDQDQAIKEILEDMSKDIPMDRLLIWDVWFWKTEVAFNAIYRAFLNKKQSVFIAPLLVLAYEHYEKAIKRFEGFWVKIAILTRLENSKKEAEILKKLANWEIDLIIWTHKLLNDKIKFKDLWLIIIDEEHKFWVKDKEKLKEFKASIDSLAMSATPIPRSLNMALSKLREISILKTPPIGRQNVSTIVNKFNEELIKEAWNREFERNWQMFFVHNRVSNIENYKTLLQKIFPDKKIIVAHWQLTPIELEKRILDFKNKKYDILVSTTVIENWIDFPNVNTIIINNATNFWLSQIHQLRWRVWRSDRKWYCYLLYKNEKMKDETKKRLKTIVEYSYIWAWFELALKDLEIRWGWDLLGFRQSGQSSQVWINLYIKLIEDEIEKLENSQKNKKIDTKIDLNIDIFIEDNLFNNEFDKINFYREIENLSDLWDLEEIKKDFVLNQNKWLENLFLLLETKILASDYKITNIKKLWINYQINFEKDIKLEELKKFLDLDKEVKFIVKDINTLRSPTKNFENDEKFLQYLNNLLKNKVKNKKIRKKIIKK